MGNQESVCACWVDSPELVRTSPFKYSAAYPTYVVDEEPSPRRSRQHEQPAPTETTSKTNESQPKMSERVVKRKGTHDDPPTLDVKRKCITEDSPQHVSKKASVKSPRRQAPIPETLNTIHGLSQRATIRPLEITPPSRVSSRLSTAAINGESPRRVSRASIESLRGISIYEADFTSFSDMSSMSGNYIESRMERGTSRGGGQSREDVEHEDHRDNDCWQDHEN